MSKLFQRNTNHDEWLVPYLEGELDEAQAARVQARLAADPALTAEAERLRQTLGHLRRSAGREPNPTNASVPADLWPRLRQRLEPAPAPRRTAHFGWMAGVGAAAALALAAVWLPIRHTQEQQPQPPRIERSKPRPPRVAQVPENERQRSPLAVNSGGTRGANSSPTPPEARAGERSSLSRWGAGKPQSAPVLSAHDPFAAPPKRMAKATIVPAPSPAASKVIPPGAPSRPTQMAARLSEDHHGDSAVGASHYDAPATSGLDTRDSPPAPAAVVPAVPAPPPRIANGAAGAMMHGQDQSAPKPLPGGLGSQPQTFGSSSLSTPLHRSRAPRPALKIAPGVTVAGPLNDGNTGQTLETWQNALAQALQKPLLGDTLGEQQANQALMAVQQGGALETLRARLEQKCHQSPRDLLAARMLAATYEFGGQSDAALRERRRLTALDGATGEDWFALAEAEGKASNSQAAREAYGRALAAPAPLSSQHAALAKQRG